MLFFYLMDIFDRGNAWKGLLSPNCKRQANAPSPDVEHQAWGVHIKQPPCKGIGIQGFVDGLKNVSSGIPTVFVEEMRY